MERNKGKFTLGRFLIFYLSFSTSTAPLALAATFNSNPSLPPVSVSSIGGFATLLCTVAGWFFVFFIVLSVIFIILAAYNILLARAGDSQRSRVSSQQFFYALAAFVVAVLARAVPLVVTSFVGTTTGVQSC